MTTTQPLRQRLKAALLAGAVLSAAFAAPAAWAVQSADDDGGLNSLSGTYLAARTADAAKDIPNAAAFYQSALQADPQNLFLLERALTLTAAAGDMELAVGFAEDVLARAPNNNVARLVLTVDSIRAERYREAIDRLEKAGNDVLSRLTRALLTAWALFGEGEVDRALESLAKLEGESWYEPFKFLHTGYMALASGRTEDALKAFEKAREIDNNAVRVTEAHARALALAGRRDEAIAALQEFISRFPDNALAHAALEDVRAGKGEGAVVATPRQGAAEALAGIGAALGEENGLEVASLYLRLSLHLDPETAGGLAAISLGNLLDASGQSEAAIEVFRSIPPDAPFRAMSQLRAALALDRLDRTEDAEKAFKEALSSNPDDVQAYISYGNMLRGRERFAESAAIYSEAIKRVPNPGRADWSLFYFRGIAHERTKNWDAAEADFKKALELYPDQPLVLNYLGYSWVDMGRNLEEALDMIRKAVELRPEDGYIVDSLGWAYYKLGRYEEAVTELERAVALKPDDPVIHDHLGDAYWKTGRTLEAQFQWRHARDFGAEGPELERILRKISEGRLIEEKKDAALPKGAAVHPTSAGAPAEQGVSPNL